MLMILTNMLYVEQDQVILLRFYFQKEFIVGLDQSIKNLRELLIKLYLKIEIFISVLQKEISSKLIKSHSK